jgi:hypothetical protein
MFNPSRVTAEWVSTRTTYCAQVIAEIYLATRKGGERKSGIGEKFLLDGNVPERFSNRCRWLEGWHLRAMQKVCGWWLAEKRVVSVGAEFSSLSFILR